MPAEAAALLVWPLPILATILGSPNACANASDWLKMFGGVFLERIPPERREAFVHEVEQQLRPSLYYEGRWHADYRRLRVVAHKPATA